MQYIDGAFIVRGQLQRTLSSTCMSYADPSTNTFQINEEWKHLHLTAILWLTEKISNLQNELKSGGLRRATKWSDHKALDAHKHAYNKKRSAHLL